MSTILGETNPHPLCKISLSTQTMWTISFATEMLVVPARLADFRKMLRQSDEGLLKNLDTMLNLNPYAKIARRLSLLAKEQSTNQRRGNLIREGIHFWKVVAHPYSTQQLMIATNESITSLGCVCRSSKAQSEGCVLAVKHEKYWEKPCLDRKYGKEELE